MSSWGGCSQEGVSFNSSASFVEAMTDMAITLIMVTSLPHQGLFPQSSGETSVLQMQSKKGERLIYSIVVRPLLDKGHSKQD